MKSFTDNIFDIRINKESMYIEKRHYFKAKTIEEQIKQLPYSGEDKTKDEIVENTYLPPFIVSFYKYIFEHSEIPTENNLAKYYFREYFEDAADGKIKLQTEYIDNFSELLLNKEGVFHRLLRTYPSIIRDFHFLLLCYEDKAFKDSYYSLNIDYFGGYDIVVKGKNVSYGVSLYIDTRRGNYYKRKKKKRHTYEEMVEIELKADRTECIQCGNIYLFTQEHVVKLKKILIENNNK